MKRAASGDELRHGAGRHPDGVGSAEVRQFATCFVPVGSSAPRKGATLRQYPMRFTVPITLGGTSRVRHGISWLVMLCCTAFGIACSSHSGGDSCDAGTALQIDCGAGQCTGLSVAGDVPNPSASQFGLADPVVFHDPVNTGRSWLAYSWPEGRALANPDGGAPLSIYTVSNHLASSTDSGASWNRVANLWPATQQADPVSGQQGFVNSESCSILGVSNGGTATWYGVHMRFFLKPIAGYNPDIDSFTFRVTAATGPTPQVLANSPEAVLGDAHTHAAWNVTTRLNSLSPDLGDCILWNNPGLFYAGGKLYLTAECMAFVGSVRDAVRSRISTFSTTPSGPPASWVWSYSGTLADHALASTVGAGLLQQPNISVGGDGTVLAIFSPGNIVAGGLQNGGCAVFPMVSFDPPAYQKDCAGNPVLRGRITGPAGAGSCTYDAAIGSGVIFTLANGGGFYSLAGSPLRP